MEIATIRIKGMQTDQCAEKVARALTAANGVSSATVSLSGSRASINFDGMATSVDALKQVVRDSGFEIKPVHGEDGVCCGSCSG